MITWNPTTQQYEKGAPIIVPFALSEGNSATFTLPWFVQESEYHPKEASFEPLVNGEQAFAAVYDAISNAEHSIDIICWGFQPSMHFKRGPGGQGCQPIGQLLENKGLQGRKIRLLVWSDMLHGAQWSENPRPGDNLASIRGDTRTSTQREFDNAWYARAQGNNLTRRFMGSMAVGAPIFQGARMAADQIHRQFHAPFKNIDYATRDFDIAEHAEIAWRTWMQGKDAERSRAIKAGNSAAMGLFPTHHQKMVLVDYEHPRQAVGFVMGHNTLDEYWDTSRHSATRMPPQMGRNGNGPRQDISSRLSGPILVDLNANFCQAWDEATGQQLAEQRRGAPKPQVKRSTHRPMVQVLRTQPQKKVRDIEKLYMGAVNNAHNFLYIENQYFRFPPLADSLRRLTEAYRRGGSTAPLYLFVVTNASGEGIGEGTVNTYRMLKALGRGDTMQGVGKLERDDALEKEYAQADAQIYRAQQRVRGLQTVYPRTPEQDAKLAEAEKALAQARKEEAQRKQARQQAKNQPVAMEPIEGLKVHVCSLVAADSPPGKPWTDVYVHAKLMIVDDVFTTLGSANINTRSMMGDSELNVCHEHGALSQELREQLWDMHTKGMGVGKKDGRGILDAEGAFKDWQTIIDINKERQSAPHHAKQPYAPLIEFRFDDPTRTYLD